MAQLKALVVKDPRTITVRTDELPKYVSSPRAGRTAYLEYCRRTRNEGTPERRRARLSRDIEDLVTYIRSITEDVAKWQKTLNAARGSVARYERLIAEGAEGDPKDLAIYAQEFDSIANLEGVTEIGINDAGQFFVVFMARRQLQNGKWCDFGDWKIHPSVKLAGWGEFAARPIRLRNGVKRESQFHSYPHYRTQFCWGNYGIGMNTVMGDYVDKGLYFEILSHASEALMTFTRSEAECAEYFKQLKADDRPVEVKIDPRARQHYVDAKIKMGSNHATALREAQEALKTSTEMIASYGEKSKAERTTLAALRQELAEVERQIAEAINPEAVWLNEFDEFLESPDVVAVKVYEYDDVQSLKFVVRPRYQTRRCVYYLGDYEIDFRLYRHGTEGIYVNRLNSGLIPEVENGPLINFHQAHRPGVGNNEVRRFNADKGEMLGKLRAIIQRLSTPDNPQYPARYYYALQEA